MSLCIGDPVFTRNAPSYIRVHRRFYRQSIHIVHYLLIKLFGQAKYTVISEIANLATGVRLPVMVL